MNDFFSWTLFTYKNVRNMVTTKNLNSCCIYLYLHGHRHCLATVVRTFYWLSVPLISSAWQLVNNHRDRNLSDLLVLLSLFLYQQCQSNMWPILKRCFSWPWTPDFPQIPIILRIMKMTVRHTMQIQRN